MKSIRLLSHAATAALSIACSFAFADPIVAIDGAGSGLVAPSVAITFDEHVLPQDTLVSNQFADLGVTFTPALFYTPYDPDNQGDYAPATSGKYLGNSATGSASTVSSFTIMFNSPTSRAAFGIAANDSAFQFEAFLGGLSVGSFSDADVTAAYYGFTGTSFDSIVVTSLDADYFLFDNLQFDVPRLVTDEAAVVPEPEIVALFGLGLLGAAVMRRKSSRSKAR